MKRAFDIRLEIGTNVYAENYTIVAPNATEAIERARRAAISDNGGVRRVGNNPWRVTSLTEQPRRLVA